MVAERNKKGTSGAAATYVTRAKALRMLQLSLSDFRRLCILKGKFPRDPRNKFEGPRRTYYLKKDIQFLAHEPLINKFRELAAFRRRYRRALARGEFSQAALAARSSPVYSLEHLIRERYPSFTDALAELDDALTMVHTFAEISRPGDGRRGVSRGLFPPARLENCARLAREWQLFLMLRPGHLRRLFASVRGFYFEAQIEGVRILWSQPHRFVQYVPPSVDLKVMSTFLEFHEALLHFVLLRLYRRVLGVEYPPRVDRNAESRGALLREMMEVRTLAQLGPIPESNCIDVPLSVSRSNRDSTDSNMHDSTGALRLASAGTGTGAAASQQVQNGTDVDEEALETVSNQGTHSPETTAPPPSLVDGLAQTDHSRDTLANLFRGLYFYVHRETPVHILEMVLYACGAEAVGYESPCTSTSPLTIDDDRIHYVIADRPLEMLPSRRLDREYIQPQWVFDSINEAFRLPTWLYRVGRRLPPHLSPWESELEEETRQRLQHTDAASSAEVQRPAYRLYLERVKTGATSVPLPKELAWLEEPQASVASGSDSHTNHLQTNPEIAASQRPLDAVDSDHEATLDAADSDSDDDGDVPEYTKSKHAGTTPIAVEKKLAEQRHRQRMLLSRRKQRLYDELVARQLQEQKTGTSAALVKRPRHGR
ncbi:nucleolar protein pescadillo [Cyanidioschyzon merolae strain 10D]|uniref:Pescadillo homolog n=1 Tax=Cyanidioschyzon merolae (strain NIES-3377 / 10D) TaxID=280699 RepID=M1V7I0_CYAM1|nr:nucleolar protein pescadillo [Cyanidioschyzon merolae strain 10D]BAM83120.1 nucleolar protein pescadillo [Cyanidioschyzon merolae strain 10D]|eukprot:XP_005539156.1 nucleolar protein pescadillo [Cyanidioschyzon merolae strain 10D]